jgi:hypothetical protein
VTAALNNFTGWNTSADKSVWFCCTDGNIRISGSKGKKYTHQVPAGSMIDMFVDTEKGAMAFNVNGVFKGTAA